MVTPDPGSAHIHVLAGMTTSCRHFFCQLPEASW
jgi:hypothetical protein